MDQEFYKLKYFYLAPNKSKSAEIGEICLLGLHSMYKIWAKLENLASLVFFKKLFVNLPNLTADKILSLDFAITFVHKQFRFSMLIILKIYRFPSDFNAILVDLWPSWGEVCHVFDSNSDLIQIQIFGFGRSNSKKIWTWLKSKYLQDLDLDFVARRQGRFCLQWKDSSQSNCLDYLMYLCQFQNVSLFLILKK